jgi:hypothetical protein
MRLLFAIFIVLRKQERKRLSKMPCKRPATSNDKKLITDFDRYEGKIV